METLNEKWCVDEIPPEYVCSLCTTLFKDAASLPCGHTFCEACIEKALQIHRKCPECQETNINIAPAYYVRRKIQSLKIVCPNGCGDELTFSQFSQHNCPKQLPPSDVRCFNCSQQVIHPSSHYWGVIWVHRLCTWETQWACKPSWCKCCHGSVCRVQDKLME